MGVRGGGEAQVPLYPQPPGQPARVGTTLSAGGAHATPAAEESHTRGQRSTRLPGVPRSRIHALPGSASSHASAQRRRAGGRPLHSSGAVIRAGGASFSRPAPRAPLPTLKAISAISHPSGQRPTASRWVPLVVSLYTLRDRDQGGATRRPRSERPQRAAHSGAARERRRAVAGPHPASETASPPGADPRPVGGARRAHRRRRQADLQRGRGRNQYQPCP